MRQASEVEVGGKRLEVSNLNKVLFPKVGFTKGQLIDYYAKISPVLLPHLKNRPLTLKRYPNGVEAEFFYEKQCPAYRPKWIDTGKVWSEHNQRHIDYCLINDLPALVWAANLADLELHTQLSRYPKIQQPTAVVFDLDPGAPADIVPCCQVALWLRAILSELNLEAFPKTSGSKGLQIYLPLNTATTYENTKPFAKKIAERLEREHPKMVVSQMAKSLRPGKVFVDWSQNHDHKTTVCVYSLRAKDIPTVSTPVAWREVELALKKGDPQKLFFKWDDVLQRVEKHGDLFEPLLTMKQRLPKM